MAIESISYKDGFRIKFQWRAGVHGTVIYSIPRGGELLDEAELMEATRKGTLHHYNGFSYGSGASSVVYAPRQQELVAAWIDICYCDYDSDFNVIFHERKGSYFNGICKVGGKIELFPISSTRQAVRITVQNTSKFNIEANGIGYSVNGREYGIPLPLEQSRRKTLPQFDIGMDETVQLCQMKGGYPATFYELDRNE